LPRANVLIEQPATQGQVGAANPPGFAHSCRLEEEFSLWEICDQELFRLPPLALFVHFWL